MVTRTATLLDGRSIKYVETPDPPQGAMKTVYFTPDGSEAVALFHDPVAAADPRRLARLTAVVGHLNPTATPQSGAYWKQLFCWPSGVVVRPTLGVIVPRYPAHYFFASGPFRGREKKGRWFSSPKLRRLIPPSERGALRGCLLAGIELGRAVNRLHMAGLAHADLSDNNVLIDPAAGRCVVIDLDSLVVPGLFPPDVFGTPGYAAPEVVAGQHLPPGTRGFRTPDARADLHALAVLLYESLLFRHPLRGPKIHAATAEEDERLALGRRALFVENPTDRSNRPPDIGPGTRDLGPHLHSLFDRAFVSGLHDPAGRPAAAEWERALARTLDLLHPCANPDCPHRWFVAQRPAATRCPFCGTRVTAPIPFLRLSREFLPGQWREDAALVVYEGCEVRAWHALGDRHPGPSADRTRLGYFARLMGKWLLVNEGLGSLTSPGGAPVPVGSAVELKPGARFRLAHGPAGRVAEVDFFPA